VTLGGGHFLMSEVPLYLATATSKVYLVFPDKRLRKVCNILGLDPAEQRGHSVQVVRPCVSIPTLQQRIQGYLAHKK
jgi:hypothetical protein